MKRFRYAHEKFDIGQTMTVTELCAKLSEFPKEMPVLAAWEGIYTFFSPKNFEVKRYAGGAIHPDDGCECVVIDVDQY